MPTMSIINKNMSENISVGIYFSNNILIMQIVIHRMRAVVHPRKKRLTDNAVNTTKFRLNCFLRNSSKQLEIIFNDSPHSILNPDF